MSSPFAQPSAGGEKFEPKDFGGALLLIYPKSYNPNETTTFGPSTSADCDIVVVDRPDPTNPNQPFIRRNARLFGNLANSVRDSIGGQVLGRLGQVPTNKGNPAWVLQNYTDADVAAATPVDAAWKAGAFAPPANFQSGAPAQAPPPARDPWAGVNAAPAPPQQQAWGQAPPAAAPPAQQQWQAPPAAQAPPPAAAPGPEDPSIAFLISKGLPEAQVRAMDPQTRASVAATY